MQNFDLCADNESSLNYLHSKGIKLQDQVILAPSKDCGYSTAFASTSPERGIKFHMAEQYVSAIGHFLEMHSKCDGGYRMNLLRQASTDYFAIRRTLGFKLVRSGKLLGQFILYLKSGLTTNR